MSRSNSPPGYVRLAVSSFTATCAPSRWTYWSVPTLG